ncbi:MAG TPA: protein tyrosine phosphatase [Candidatus Nanoarchaeia archaeon]|nr:protein tyrosine phosphatase [Candidatus Nanoarchaeia archaeon]
MNLLFICNQNENRSKTAAELFKDTCNTKSAGLYSKQKVSRKDISWSDVVIVMEEEQRSEIAKRFPKEYLQKRILSFDIPDIYHYNNPTLIKELKARFNKFKECLV